MIRRGGGGGGGGGGTAGDAVVRRCVLRSSISVRSGTIKKCNATRYPTCIPLFYTAVRIRMVVGAEEKRHPEKFAVDFVDHRECGGTTVSTERCP